MGKKEIEVRRPRKRVRYFKEMFPQQVDLRVLRAFPPEENPYGPEFDYRAEFEKLDYEAVKRDLRELMIRSQEWWPADFGHYGPLFVRLAWHSAGSYRLRDGRGGANRGLLRLPPRIDWPDNVNLDKAIRLLWPVKRKYGRRLSWADLLILAGNVALESMGFKLLGFGGGRVDAYEPDDYTDWGPEEVWLEDRRRTDTGGIQGFLAASQMGLIYVNPEGPGGNPDPLAAAREIRMVFGLMGMNDEETVALIAGGHTVGKCHGKGRPDCLGPSPSGASLEEQGLGWKNSCGEGKGPDTFTSGLELTWTQQPVKFTMLFLKNLFTYEYELTRSPAGAHQWVAKDAPETVPDAYDPERKHRPGMLTTDLALKFDPDYARIARRFLENPEEFQEAFARAWFKLTHRDMGPRTRYLGPEVPEEEFVWQDPVPPVDHDLVEREDLEVLKERLLGSGLSLTDLVYVAWASASTFRVFDYRGGANGARIRFAPQRKWEVNMPERLDRVLGVLEEIQRDFNTGRRDGKRISLADLIVLGGSAAVEEAARRAGFEVEVPFYPGRTDAREDQIDVQFYTLIEPVADGFRNYHALDRDPTDLATEEWLVEKAAQLALSAREMTVLVGGLRVLNANWGETPYGVFTKSPGTLTNEFFVNLLDPNTEWLPVNEEATLFEGRDRRSGEKKWEATRADLVFGYHPQLRAIAEVYAADDAAEKFVHDFVSAWTKVMNLDRFDLRWW
ncbi:catalase/peroxidase HPI [Thermosulfurimonas sp. F29]|uniref:catalase/peroxidase HPI n=1 Tax=Thermosulfurimonas sp. F29 TaxID=2867247 RepID=UPI001C831E30|nr:catalase/peroxidase HPI [Thermosulfurimonas sp. F29]MBX6422279.1 catalase/peroxidase HPI [Thermosulfurimonas sp. F29]